MIILKIVTCVLAGCGVASILGAFGVNNKLCAVCSGIVAGLLAALLM